MRWLLGTLAGLSAASVVYGMWQSRPRVTASNAVAPTASIDAAAPVSKEYRRFQLGKQYVDRRATEGDTRIWLEASLEQKGTSVGAADTNMRDNVLTVTERLQFVGPAGDFGVRGALKSIAHYGIIDPLTHRYCAFGPIASRQANSAGDLTFSSTMSRTIPGDRKTVDGQFYVIHEMPRDAKEDCDQYMLERIVWRIDQRSHGASNTLGVELEAVEGERLLPATVESQESEIVP